MEKLDILKMADIFMISKDLFPTSKLGAFSGHKYINGDADGF